VKDAARAGSGPGAGGTAHHEVAPVDEGLRLDRFCALRHPEVSRSRLAVLIREGHITLDGRAARPSEAVRAGSRIEIAFPPAVNSSLVPEAIALAVVYEDADLLVIDKPAGLVVHPGAGVRQGTLAAALLHHDAGLLGVGGAGRSGLVHRLDRGTSGLMVVARHDAAHRALTAQFHARTVEKIYDAIVWGRPREREGEIDLGVGRDPKHRVRMRAGVAGGRAARSLYRVVEEVPGFAWLEVRILTGRTHQVRVHLAALGHPIVGDATYGGERSASVGDARRRNTVRAIGRPALHARRLAFDHPRTSARRTFESPWPDDLCALWSALGGRLP
jgi:23S rRNA pseudouridine1911/1915/1917 synthase